MALIPPDVGVRMRLPGDGPLQPATPISGIPSDLPDLQPGQIFQARIQEILPENTYRALVAGKSLTLALPEGAKAGDVLELVVIERGTKAITARTVASDTLDGAELSKNTTLSPAAQLIGRLLSEEPGSRSAALNRGQPLLNAPPNATAPLASALQQAVTQSGLFYESHQAQWIAGKLPLTSLLQEPQGQLSKLVPAMPERQSPLRAADEVETDSASPTNKAPAISTDDVRATSNSETTTLANRTETQVLPSELRPLVHQQLEAAANQRLLWHGEAWPGQPMEWEIEEEKQQAARDAEEAQPWLTTLKLSTPRLGSVEAKLRISGNNLQLNLTTPVGATAADLRDELPALTDALAAAGITLKAAQVRHESE